ncbi:MAG: Ohr family peroxiredoxin [Actinomycetaceae bacterium]|nr:Ohr family peroxiredoxin [Actinomycetaceae bacterium]
MNKVEDIKYQAVAISTGGRGGKGYSHNPDVTMKLDMPQELGGKGEGTNPEQLFAIGYGACFQGALALAGKAKGVSVEGSKVRTTVGLGPEGDSFAIKAGLEVAIPGMELAQVQELADLTHELCPYSKAIRGNVEVTVRAVENIED